ncbi:MAG: hypothetical protein IT173_12745 [Acidobacteria bacterium]|nr:hypothetical protein [Acidobacteriota bacterium]
MSFFVNDSLHTRFGVDTWFNYQQPQGQYQIAGASGGALTFDILALIATKKVGGALPEAKFNPFFGKSPAQVENMFIKKGFEPRGPDPLGGLGGYVNPRSGRSYHIDLGGTYRRGVELPHVDVNRRTILGNPPIPKRKFPL